MNALHLAVYFSQDTDRWYNYERVIKLLLSPTYIGIDVNSVDGLKRTPLHWAAMRGFQKVWFSLKMSKFET